MIFGDPERFAIEVAFALNVYDIWMDGWSCYWISGQRVGDFGYFDSQRDLLSIWEKMSYYRDRTSHDLFRLDTQELFTILYLGLYGEEKADEQRGIEGQWIRHNINTGSAAFTGWKVFLVDNGTAARCVYAPSGNPFSRANEQQLRLREFDTVLDDCVAYLLKEYEQFEAHES